jgi:hypothetical protein
MPERSPRMVTLRRTIALGIGMPVAVMCAAASCFLADPPPALPTIAAMSPTILTSSVVPPLGIITNWDSGDISFVVPVSVIDPTSSVAWAFVEDDMTAAAVLLSTRQAMMTVDGGTIQTIDFDSPAPSKTACHTITAYVGLSGGDFQNVSLEEGIPGVQCSLCEHVTWIFDPSGVGGCPVYDAGGIPDSAILRDARPDAAD